MNIAKPKGMGQKTLLVIMNIRDVPTEPQDMNNMTYSKSNLAINEGDGLVQAFVSAPDTSGINDFKRHYPNAVEVSEEEQLNPEKWRLLAFPRESTGNVSPLEVFFKGRNNSVVEKEERDKIKKQDKPVVEINPNKKDNK